MIQAAERCHALFALLLLTLLMSGCASLPAVGDPSNALVRTGAASKIHWPEKYRPVDAAFFVHNETRIAAPPEAIWSQLIQAEAWPSWYEGAENVKLQSGAGGTLTQTSTFTWNTMGLDFTSVVKEFEPPFRLSWESRKSSIQGYHAWLIVPFAGGCTLVTEESQHGWLTFFQKLFVPSKLRRLHDIWLAQIKSRAEASARPPGQVTPAEQGVGY